MICYSLRCGAEHEFEAWFRDSTGYDEQRASGEVTCPVCGDTDVTKAPMAPAVPRKGRAADDDPVARRTEELANDVVEAVEKLREHVEANCDYVGDAFPDEARKIHYGEAEERGIYGETSVEEAEALGEEGIEVYSLPTIKQRRTN